MLLPLAVGVIFEAPLTPVVRRLPAGVPLPVPDGAELIAGGVAAAGPPPSAERARSSAAARRGTRALGSSAPAGFHALEAHPPEGDERDRELQHGPRRGRQGARRGACARARPGSWRCAPYSSDGFLTEVARFEETGQVSSELEAVAGTFVQSMTGQGWCAGHHLAAGPDVPSRHVQGDVECLRRARGAGRVPSRRSTRCAPSSAFYLGHPHAPSSVRDRVLAMRQRCARRPRLRGGGNAPWSAGPPRSGASNGSRGSPRCWIPRTPPPSREGYRAFRRRLLRGLRRCVRGWLEDHPDGPYTLRAQAFLRAAVAAARID